MTPAEFKSIRLQLGLTQRAWGERLGYGANHAEQMVNAIERGRRGVPPDKALKAALLRDGVPIPV